MQRAVVRLRLLDEVPGENVARQLDVSSGHVALGQSRHFWLSADYFRGRDASYLAPPAQIRTGQFGHTAPTLGV
jgi:hypothetical protein